MNDELGQLAGGLAAAERLLPEDARLVVVTFHSLEDRIVKRYFQIASGRAGRGSRHAPARDEPQPRYRRPSKVVEPSAAEIARNPRARSARLRAARRTSAPPVALDGARLGLPPVPPIERLIAGARR